VDVSQSQDEQGAMWDWDEEPPSSPKAGVQRGDVLIALRLAKIGVPVIAAAVLAGLVGGGGSSKQVYSGDTTAASVTLQLASHGPLSKGALMHCTTAAKAAGAVSHCTVNPSDQLSSDLVEFDVDYVDAQGDYTFKPPGTPPGSVIKGNVFQ
jgi:hypothetical protein